MFQDYETRSDKQAGPERLSELRRHMQKQNLTHFLVPHADEHQNEYLPERAERLAWLTGFTGSAGFAIAGLEDCVVFVDGRYTLQVRQQVDADSFTPESLVDCPPSKWLQENTVETSVIGYDPWLTTSGQLKSYQAAVAISGATLRAIENLVDLAWPDQPTAPLGPVKLHPVEFSGEEASAKIARIQSAIADQQAELTVLTDPASLAWLFNIRGSDVVHNPLPLGFAVVATDGRPVLFMDEEKFSKQIRKALEVIAEIAPPDQLEERLQALSAKKTVLFDEARNPVALAECITRAEGTIKNGRDPVILPRAIKNRVEIDGARKAHVRDGIAMCKFLHWLDSQPFNALDEIAVAKKLEETRAENAKEMGSKLMEISFDTISGHGPNGAIVHYRVSEASNRPFTDNSLYLCDSGGQYQDGTTDITRTIAIGAPPREAVRDFTLVLKGHIAIATARFPKGTTGADIDTLARIALWQNGKDFAHGTGHGVGSYLNVHEGPQSISRRGKEPLLPGMIISNEPGYYVEDAYGIRIENLVLVEDLISVGNGNVETMGFETITLAPIDLRLVDANLLDREEINWLNAYHSRVFETASHHLSDAQRRWLQNATRAI